jgi:hypothetical protein
MSRYRRIEMRIWSDERFRQLSPLEPSGQALTLVLIFGPQTRLIPGLYRCSLTSLADEMRWSPRKTAQAFREVEAQGIVVADHDARLFWLPNALKHNMPANPNVIVLGRPR